MSHDAGRHCDCQAEHRPAPLDLERHHVWPLAMGGPDTAANIEWLCPTAHTNVHEILRTFMAQGHLTWGQVGALYDVPVSRHAYAIATLGYRRVIGRSMTP